MSCNHVGFRVYAKRVFKDGSIHYCVQCLNCLRAVKLEGKKGVWLKAEDLPPDSINTIRNWIDDDRNIEKVCGQLWHEFSAPTTEV